LRPGEFPYCAVHPGVELGPPPADSGVGVADAGGSDASVEPALWCARCEALRPGEFPFCSLHPGEELVPRPDPAPSVASGAGDGSEALAASGTSVEEEPERRRSACWNCGARSPNVTNPSCSRCHESLVPPALLIQFADGPVVVQSRGASADLGRAGTYGHIFARYPNVSRRHATVSVDDRGDAWLAPNPLAPNGTFLNGSEIDRRTIIVPGDQIRFATDQGPHFGPVSVDVRLPQRE
jgi:hypothetical protein